MLLPQASTSIQSPAVACSSYISQPAIALPRPCCATRNSWPSRLEVVHFQLQTFILRVAAFESFLQDLAVALESTIEWGEEAEPTFAAQQRALLDHRAQVATAWRRRSILLAAEVAVPSPVATSILPSSLPLGSPMLRPLLAPLGITRLSTT